MEFCVLPARLQLAGGLDVEAEKSPCTTVWMRRPGELHTSALVFIFPISASTWFPVIGHHGGGNLAKGGE